MPALLSNLPKYNDVKSNKDRQRMQQITKDLSFISGDKIEDITIDLQQNDLAFSNMQSTINWGNDQRVARTNGRNVAKHITKTVDH